MTKRQSTRTSVRLMLVPMMTDENGDGCAAEPKLGDTVEHYDVVLLIFVGEYDAYSDDWSFDTYEKAERWLDVLSSVFPNADECEDLTEDIRLSN